MSSVSLSSIVQLGSLQLRNRNWMSALTRNRSYPTNVPNDTNVEYYAQRAKGGAGLIVSEGALIRQQGSEWAHAPGLWSEEHVAGWEKVTDAVHQHGGAIFAQLWHVGRVAHPDMPEQKAAGVPVYGPSAVAARGGRFRELPGEPGYVTPTAVEDPTTLIKEFRFAAEQAKRAGFDGVELHGASGYLVNQFLDSSANVRTDKWGGSAENRSRFAVETLKELIEVYGAERVGLKLTPTGGYNDMGMPLADAIETFSTVINEAVKLNIGYVALVRGIPAPPTEPKQPNPGTYHDVLETYGPLIKRSGSSTLLGLNLNLTPEEGDKLIKEGTIDVAFYGRPWINNPDFEHRLEQGVPVSNEINWPGVYGFKEHISEGYSDYPSVTA